MGDTPEMERKRRLAEARLPPQCVSGVLSLVLRASRVIDALNLVLCAMALIGLTVYLLAIVVALMLP